MAGLLKKKKKREGGEIPTASMADIAFLLLIFFMVTTTFRTDRERPIDWAEAEATTKIDEKAKNILNIWVERNGTVFVNDQQLAMDQLSDMVRPLYAASQQFLVISIRADRETSYRTIDLVQKELQQAGVARVVFATALEQRMTRERR